MEDAEYPSVLLVHATKLRHRYSSPLKIPKYPCIRPLAKDSTTERKMREWSRGFVVVVQVPSRGCPRQLPVLLRQGTISWRTAGSFLVTPSAFKPDSGAKPVLIFLPHRSKSSTERPLRSNPHLVSTPHARCCCFQPQGHRTIQPTARPQDFLVFSPEKSTILQTPKWMPLSSPSSW